MGYGTGHDTVGYRSGVTNTVYGSDDGTGTSGVRCLAGGYGTSDMRYGGYGREVGGTM